MKTVVNICRHGKPVADLTPHVHEASGPLVPDPELAGARFHGDPSAPLTAEDWAESQR